MPGSQSPQGQNRTRGQKFPGDKTPNHSNSLHKRSITCHTLLWAFLTLCLPPGRKPTGPAAES